MKLKGEEVVVKRVHIAPPGQGKAAGGVASGGGGKASSLCYGKVKLQKDKRGGSVREGGRDDGMMGCKSNLIIYYGIHSFNSERRRRKNKTKKKKNERE